MKRLLLASAITLATAATAAASMMSAELNSNVAFQVTSILPGADLSNLSGAQVNAIENIFSASGADSAGNDVRGQVQKILGWNA
jgi:hypothetical protein